ncbi:uncharacterized protein [Engystomops pustulosus]|uniref:uncharacterized protein isoform X2 n=1 Tax=Engystomops pustulosus TaxID=76066 RepID=UPI003AFA2F89
MSEAEKENLRQQLSGRIHLLNQLRDEAQELETHMERQRREMERRQREIHELQRHLDGLSPQDPRHSHVTAQKISKEQQLEMMDKQYKQLEGRLDDMLSRISRETEEIRDLEQQLTEGQIAANEALKRDLEGIISGLQDYLESVKGGARQAQEQCRELQAEREVLLHRMEAVAQEAEHRRQEVQDLERSLQEAQEVNEALRQAQEVQQEAQVVNEALRQAQEAQVVRLQQELQQQQAESSALKTELERERRAMERAMTKVQDRERDSKRLLPQVQALQEENGSLKLQVGSLGARLCDAVNNLVHPEQIIARVSDLKRKLQAGAGEVRSLGPSDVLGQNLAELQQQVHQMLAKSEEERMEAQERERRLQEEVEALQERERRLQEEVEALQERERRLQEEVEALQERARQAPQDYKRAAEAKMELEKRQHEATARQLENEVRLLSEKLQTMDEIQVLAERQLLEAEEERERLLEELRELEAERRVEDSRAQKDVSGLDLQLKELKKSVAKSDLTASAELTRTKDQLQALHSTVHQINRERAEEKQEVENYNSQAARAARDLAKAEAEIELLQDLLHDKEKQLQEELQTGLSVSNSQQLNHTLQEQRAQVERLKHLLEHTRSDNAVEMEDLLDEIESLRRALRNQSDYISSAADPSRRIRYWCYPPPPSSASAHDSVSTKDSGISLHSPARCPHRKQEAAAPGVGGRCVCSLCRGLRDDEAPPPCTPPPCPPPGSVIYTVFPDGSPAPPGTVIYGPPPPSAGGSLAVIYGPPPTGAHLVYGPPPPHFTIPIIPAGVLHCNVAAHQELEHEVSRLEDLVHHLEDQRGALQREGRELRDAARKRTHRDFVESLKLELEMERCLHHHGNMEDEICCLEETLLRRRAELREADRVLAQAQEKTMGLTEKYNETKQQLRQAERDAEELERRAQDTAINLVKADQQLRTLQSITCDLEQQRAAQENALQSINSVMAAKDAEYQSLTQKMEATAQRLQKLQDEIVVLEMTEVERLRAVEDMETLALERLQCQEEAQDLHSHLERKKAELQDLHSHLERKKAELQDLHCHLEQKKAELQDLHCHLEQKKAELQEVLQEGEQALARRRQDIQEVKSLLEDVSAEKEEASAELRERRAQLSSLRLEVCRAEAQVHQQRAELQRVLEMQQIEDNELKALKLQHNQKMIDLEKTQSLLLQGKQELQQVQERVDALSTQRQDLQEKVDALSTQRQDLQERVGALSTQRQDLQEKVDALSTQRQDLQERVEALSTQQQDLQERVDALSTQRQDLQKRVDVLSTQQRDLQKRVDALSTQQRDLQKRVDALSTQQQDLQERVDALSTQQRDLQKRVDALSTQQQDLHDDNLQLQQRLVQRKRELSEVEAGALRRLEDQTRELDCLKEELRLLQQDVQSATNQQSHVLQQKAALQEDIVEATARLRLLRDQEWTTDERLRLLQRSAEEKELEAAQQDTRLKQIMKEMSEAEEQLRAAAERLDTERQNHQNSLDLITQKVLAQEQCAIQLQQEGRWCAALEEELDHARRQMLDREAALETCRGDMRRLQQEASARRTREEERTAALRETISRQQLQLQEAQDLRRENRSLKQQLLRMEETQERNHLLQSERDVLQEQLRSQEEVNEAVKELKAQVKLEIQKSVQDLDPNTHPLLGAHWRGELLREKLLREEERLKVLLQQGVSGQAAALGRGRQQTEGSIMRLRRRLDALQDLVSSPSHSQNSLGQDFHSDSSVSPHPTESSEPHRTRTSTD